MPVIYAMLTMSPKVTYNLHICNYAIAIHHHHSVQQLVTSKNSV